MPLSGNATTYNDVTRAIVAWLRDDPEVDRLARVREEPDMREDFVFEGGPYVDVIFEERIATSEIQRIAAGRQLGLYLVYSLWVVVFSPNQRIDAVSRRNDLIDAVENRLLTDPRFGGLCRNSWQEGGVMADSPREQNWGAAGQVRLMLEVARAV